MQAALEPVQRNLDHITGTLDAQEHQEQLADIEDRYPELRVDANAERLLEQARDYAAEVGDPSLATDPATLELLHLRSQVGGGPGRQQVQRSSPGVVRGNALACNHATLRRERHSSRSGEHLEHDPSS